MKGNNKSAFPIVQDGFLISGGLTKREYFTVKVFQALIVNEVLKQKLFDEGVISLMDAAVQMADSLIAALGEEE